jgi:hypothetical protein
MSKKISLSPERGSFQRQAAKLRALSAEDDVINIANDGVDFDVIYKSVEQLRLEQEQDPEWQKNNLEWDLRTTDWILDKVRINEIYAQHLYAALCNNMFCKMDSFRLLREEYWHCSWRSAGGILSDMRMEGDYIDWYCSGIKNDDYQREFDSARPCATVTEGTVTDEVKQDLAKLGWVVIN